MNNKIGMHAIVFTALISIPVLTQAQTSEGAVLETIQTEVNVAKSKADKNTADIESMKGGLPDLERRVSLLETTGGPKGDTGPEGPPGQDAPDRTDDICALFDHLIQYGIPEVSAPEYCGDIPPTPICSPGVSETQSCGANGTQNRICLDDGTWSGWSSCEGQSPPVLLSANVNTQSLPGAPNFAYSVDLIFESQLPLTGMVIEFYSSGSCVGTIVTGQSLAFLQQDQSYAVAEGMINEALPAGSSAHVYLFVGEIGLLESNRLCVSIF